jgi:hypothetical protein
LKEQELKFLKMKTLKLGLVLILSVCMIVVMDSCKKCKGEDPSARIINNGTDKASVQIKTSGGFTVNINNVDPGTASPYSSYAPGEITFTITVNDNEYVKTVEMSQCYKYDIAIDSDNNITSTAIDRNK